MNRNDFSELGEQIKNLVQDAVDSQNFDQLSRTIGAAVNQTLNTVGDTFNSTVNNVGKNINDTLQHVGQAFQNETQSYDHAPKGRPISKEPYYGPRMRSASRREPDITRASFSPDLVKNCTSLNIGGTALAAVGTACSVMFGLILLLLAIAVPEFLIPIVLFSVFFAGSLVMALTGFRMRKRYERFQFYLGQLRDKTYISIQNLSDSLGKSKRFVVRDLQNMIRKRMFLQGHIDEQKTCLMISDASYQQYRQLIENTKLQEEARKKPAHFSSEKEEYPEEVRKIIEEGNSYIKKIRFCKDQISDPQFSAKLSRLELIVTKIFNCVKESPDFASDLRKFMDYYLPTTWKLIDAYRTLDQQPIEGETISSSKKEISDTLDTINAAFENLLDRFFQSAAWDISTDISVLQTMLAQEGLTDQGFPGSKKKK
ncbi:MAG: 5-bromo-4-chloroindolyl phosphate hydrolysis family protein [Eubacteriales bacterium]|nr:5-bromo-4-chloroindolyl phosphate hydrolysis family protein [Eubacteriales bacterium]